MSRYLKLKPIGPSFACKLFMKTGMIFFFISLSICSYGQKLPEKEVPESVKSAFKTLYDDTQVRSWEREKFGLYEAEFKWKGKPASATFNANGILMRTELEVKKKDMPGQITEHAIKLYPRYRIRECAKISTPDGKQLYEVEITNGDDRKSLIFTENNEYLREEIDEDDDDSKAGRQ